MNWMKVVIAGLVGGVVMNLADFVMHGMIMSSTYARYPVFQQQEGNPIWFFVVAVCFGIAGAALFARTRDSWGDGAKGGATFGLFFGCVSFFAAFYNPLVFEGFPYYLAWCWGGMNLIDGVILGSVIALVYKRG